MTPSNVIELGRVAIEVTLLVSMPMFRRFHQAMNTVAKAREPALTAAAPSRPQKGITAISTISPTSMMPPKIRT